MACEDSTLAYIYKNYSVKAGTFIIKSFLPGAQNMKVFCYPWNFVFQTARRRCSRTGINGNVKELRGADHGWVAQEVLWDPMDFRLPGSSIHGILQVRILEWVAMPFSRGSGESPDPGTELGSSTLQADSLPSNSLPPVNPHARPVGVRETIPFHLCCSWEVQHWRKHVWK